MNKLLKEYLSDGPKVGTQPSSSCSSASDSSSDSEGTRDPKYKTELCRSFQTKGRCPYGLKCRFAHGAKELVLRQPHRKCNGFWQEGTCSYGAKCRFGHEEGSWSRRACWVGLSGQFARAEAAEGSKLLRMLQ